MVALGGRTRTAFSNWIASWRGALLKATRSEVSPSTSFPTHPYATLTRPAMHCAVSRDVAPDNSCWFAAIDCQRGRRWANSDADCDEEDELSEPVSAEEESDLECFGLEAPCGVVFNY